MRDRFKRISSREEREKFTEFCMHESIHRIG
jgi:hypothetical protein